MSNFSFFLTIYTVATILKFKPAKTSPCKVLPVLFLFGLYFLSFLLERRVNWFLKNGLKKCLDHLIITTLRILPCPVTPKIPNMVKILVLSITMFLFFKYTILNWLLYKIRPKLTNYAKDYTVSALNSCAVLLSCEMKLILRK